jgi:hypothetical protein
VTGRLPLDLPGLDQLLGTDAAPLPAPVDWARLDPDQACDAWLHLDGWVRWLVARYRLDHRDVPACWYRHPDLVEELSALHTSHQAAFYPESSPHAPLDWHHQLAATRHRLQTVVSRTGCRPAEHRDLPAAEWARGSDPGYAAAFGEHVADDAARRGAQPR